MAPTAFQKLRDTLGEFLARGTELAKVELTPAAKHAGIGSGLVAGAAACMFHALWMLVVALAFGIGWLFHALAGVSLLGSLTLGFVISMLVALIVGIVLALFARGQFLKVEAPHATMEEARATFVALTDAFIGADSQLLLARPGVDPSPDPKTDEPTLPSVPQEAVGNGA
ncbi:MAG: phage holin family protein [Propionibacteriaceae bacterium]|nr:phage holin family protein [Propionibacteriaceae bacterium]